MPEHRHSIRNGQNLIKFMGDNQNGSPFGCLISQERQQRPDLTWRKDRRGFVQDQDLGISQKNFEDLDPLLFAYTQALHDRVQINGKPRLLSDLGGPSTHLGEREGRELGALPSQEQVLKNGQSINEREVLVDHSHSGRPRLARRAESDFGSSYANRAGIRREFSCQDGQQGGLPRPVLPKYRVNFPLSRCECCVTQSDNRTEGPSDSGQGDVGHDPPSSSTKGIRGTMIEPFRMAARASSTWARSASGMRSASSGLTTHRMISRSAPA